MGWSRRWLITSRERYGQVLAAMREFAPNFAARPLEVIIREPFITKSSGMRGLFHAVITDFAREIGYTPGELKDVVKTYYFGADWRELGLSTEQLERDHYGDLIEATYFLAAWCGVVLPDRRQ